MVLMAIPLAQVSYLIGLRQLSVVIGYPIGVGMLGERHEAIRLLGSTLIFLGAFLKSKPLRGFQRPLIRETGVQQPLDT